MCNLPQQRKNLLEAFDSQNSKSQDDVQSEEEISEASIRGKSISQTLPFLLTFEIFNHNVHNCLLDSASSSNVMPLSVYRKINGQPTPSSCKIIQLDRTTVNVVGEMKDVLIRLSADEMVFQFIDIMAMDIPKAYGLILSRDLSAKLEGYFSTD